MIITRRAALIGGAAGLTAMALGPVLAHHDSLALYSERLTPPPVPPRLRPFMQSIRLSDPADYDRMVDLLEAWEGKRLIARLNHGDAAVMGALLHPFRRYSLTGSEGAVLLDARL